MKSTTRKFAIVTASILLMANTACTTIKPVYDTQQAPYASQIEPNDRVRITYLDGRVKEIRVTEVNATILTGGLHKASKRS